MKRVREFNFWHSAVRELDIETIRRYAQDVLWNDEHSR